MSEDMRKEERRQCPKCGETDGQMKNGRSQSGTQTYICRHCRKTYTLEPKRHAYDEETRALALKMYYAGTSGRGVGKILNMSKANVYNWIKKNGKSASRDDSDRSSDPPRGKVSVD